MRHEAKHKSILRALISVSITIMIGMSLATVAILFLLTMLSINTKVDAYWALICVPAVIAFAVPFVFVINRRAVRHIDTLTDGINKVANGDLSAHIDQSDPIFDDVYKNFNKMVREIRSAQELKSEIADSFSHELKTPISSISGCAKLLSEGNLSEEKTQKYLEIIMRDSERMAKFVRDSLLLSKLDAQEIVTDKTEYDLAEQLRDCLIGLSAEWERKNIELSVELADCTYYGNRTMTETIWNNLLSNALKYTPSGGTVRVSLECTAGSAVIKISDTGIGMNEEVQKHIFEKFYRSGSESGHGLGLSIVNKIVSLVGGTISVQSKVGEGSAFTVTLPL